MWQIFLPGHVAEQRPRVRSTFRGRYSWTYNPLPWHRGDLRVCLITDCDSLLVFGATGQAWTSRHIHWDALPLNDHTLLVHDTCSNKRATTLVTEARATGSRLSIVARICSKLGVETIHCMQYGSHQRLCQLLRHRHKKFPTLLLGSRAAAFTLGRDRMGNFGQ